VSLREWVRLTSVIKEDWNSLRYIMIIRLKHDAYAWFGGLRHHLRAGLWQLASHREPEAGTTSLPWWL
jgi:hypothetical protein